ncbi:MAG: TIGR03960 family B12-binding radical SAM protein [Actinomycetia bacterium]|nr:TIGR03960 family B12-binding radical SAM protein [Actinomycetes bacterium]
MSGDADRFLRLVARAQHPSRSIDHEWGVAEFCDDALLHGAFCYPASYELGQSNNALQILYARANRIPQVAAERVFLPSVDLRTLMREEGAELLTLETNTAVRELDFLGITLPYELSYPAVLEVLDLAGLPLHGADRDSSYPLVIGGGPCVYNPEPLAPFFDAFFIGEAEEALAEILSVLCELKDRQASRAEQLQRLGDLPGIYLPANGAQRAVKRVVARGFATDPAPCSSIVPYSEVIHDRLAVEIARGCSRGCRFCQAGTSYRPVRERPASDLLREIITGLEQTGYDEVSLTSLSATDYSQLQDLLRRLAARLAGTGVSVSLPSLRVDAFSVEAARQLSEGAKKSGLTFAPEAGSQRLRDVINKNVTDEQLLEVIRVAAAGGWRRVKLYFMIGLPTETDEDVCAIAELVGRAQDLLKSEFDHRVAYAFQITVSVAGFVPKPHTPFQWEAQDSLQELQRKQQLLKRALPRRGVTLHYHGADTTVVEGALARGDRRVAEALERAWDSGAATDAWEGDFELERWEQAFSESGLSLEQYACRKRSFDEELPWGFLATGVSSAWLRREAEAAYAGQTTPDCTFSSCSACGACQEAGIDPGSVAGMRGGRS